MTNPEQETAVLSDPAQLKAISDPLRLEVLREFGGDPRTTKQVATAMGIGTNKLYHHVDALAKVGLLRLVETRQKRGTTEKYMQAVARRFQVDASILEPGQVAGHGAMEAAFTSKSVLKLSEKQLKKLLRKSEELLLSFEGKKADEEAET